MFLISIAGKFLNLDGSGFMFVLVLMVLAFYYFIFTFFLLNKIKFDEIFKKYKYEKINIYWAFALIIFGWGHSLIILGILFYIQNWLGSYLIFSIGILIYCIFVLILLLLKFDNKQILYSKEILKRIGIYTLISIFIFITRNLGFI